MDTPRTDVFRGRRIRTAHMFSDRPGAEGTQELVARAVTLGMRPEWRQCHDTYKEHFDLMRSRVDLAIRSGVKVLTRHEAVAVWRNKRITQEDARWLARR